MSIKLAEEKSLFNYQTAQRKSDNDPESIFNSESELNKSMLEPPRSKYIFLMTDYMEVLYEVVKSNLFSHVEYYNIEMCVFNFI